MSSLSPIAFEVAGHFLVLQAGGLVPARSALLPQCGEDVESQVEAVMTVSGCPRPTRHHRTPPRPRPLPVPGPALRISILFGNVDTFAPNVLAPLPGLTSALKNRNKTTQLRCQQRTGQMNNLTVPHPRFYSNHILLPIPRRHLAETRARLRFNAHDTAL